jgi:hypothetical protein
MKTLSEWESSEMPFFDYAAPGDEVDYDIFSYFLGTAPPALLSPRVLVVGEALDNGGPDGAARYTTIGVEGNRFRYLGPLTLDEARRLPPPPPEQPPPEWSWADLLQEAEPLLKDLEPDYLNIDRDVYPESPVWDWRRHVRWIAVYCVEGGSEGWYLHVDQVWHEGRRIGLLGKFWSEDQAIEAVSRITRVVLPRAWG